MVINNIPSSFCLLSYPSTFESSLPREWIFAYKINYISSCLFSTEAKAMTSKAAATPSLFLALVWRCFIFGCLAKNSLTAYYYTSLYSLLSILFPTKMKGNFYGYLGAPWFRNYWIHDSILSKDWKIERKVPSCLWCRKREHNNQHHDKKRHPSFWTFIGRLCPKSIRL